MVNLQELVAALGRESLLLANEAELGRLLLVPPETMTTFVVEYDKDMRFM